MCLRINLHLIVTLLGGHYLNPMLCQELKKLSKVLKLRVVWHGSSPSFSKRTTFASTERCMENKLTPSFKDALPSKSKLCFPLVNLLLKLIVKEYMLDFPVGPVVKNLPANAGTWVQSLVWEDFTCCRATKSMCCNY